MPAVEQPCMCSGFGGAMGMDAATLLASPHTIVGSAAQIVDELVWQPTLDRPALRLDLAAYFRSVHDEAPG